MRRLLRALTSGAAATALVLAAAGCGGSAGETAGGTSGDGAGEGAISVTTARGPVTLDEPATRIVSLEWTYTENLLALGVNPIGHADPAGYAKWVSAPEAKLPEGVADVGTRQEPSLEKIRALKPDLIVSDESRVAANYDQLADIAPVLAFDPLADPALQTMKTNFTELAKAVGKQDQAPAVLRKLDTAAADVKARLEKADKAGLKYAVAQAFTANDAPQIRLHTDKALVAQVLNLAGLKNTWTGKPDDWGMTTVGVEGITDVPDDATFLYVAADDDNPFEEQLADNPVWTDAAFVKDDRAIALDPGTWFYGGILSSVHILNMTAKALGV
ncbi:ABC transporter substrate-binding protein [Actinomadura algeriensis]|uniref:Iron complex transport system substrate-binding protein n=1 Tax=Actinomadura algeriensis TaxID=1679523 RepID=A0ABR9JR96_9ACTN|nr:iron-siderophore ABC transporter substrate-binding protein [Actinomadura algeriensis]MBE1533093.1 iron complex transport system substrate-binding protein [Actinomadura algeriensis]